MMRFTLHALVLTPGILWAQDSPNRFTLGARLSFNVSAEFNNAGRLSALPDPPVAGTPLDRFYDDGYVGVDADSNAAGLTWYWGYRDPGQVTPAGNLDLHITSLGAARPSRGFADAPQAGLEVSWIRELKRADRATLGFKLAFNFVDVTVVDHARGSVFVRRLTDTYSLGGIIPPGDPSTAGWQYQATRDQGIYAGAPLIDEVPISRTIDSDGTTVVTGARSIDAKVFGWKLGPWIEFPLTRRVSINTSAGVAWVFLRAVTKASHCRLERC